MIGQMSCGRGEALRSVSFRAGASGRNTPGTAWNYNSGGVWLLGLILRKVSGQPIEEFAEEALFEPLGIQEEVWGRFPNGDAGTSGGLRFDREIWLNSVSSCSMVGFGMVDRLSRPAGSSR